MRVTHTPRGALAAVEVFFAGYAFPALALATLGLFAVLLATLLALPAGTGGNFAEQFRVWCFGYDPATGGMRWSMVAATFSELLLFMVVVFVIWRQPLRDQWTHGRSAYLPVAATGMVVVSALGGAFALLADTGARADTTVFPARELRTALPPPRFTLADQDGAAVSLEALRGRVVLVTAVYASCGLACPRILGQAKRAVATLTEAEQADVTVLGITLDPQRDDRGQLARMAQAQGVTTPRYRLLTGPPAEVERALDRFDITRQRNPETGVIDHANVFIVIDRAGRVAYHFTLDPQQEQWLGQALRLLLAEPVELAGRG
ncbi:MAG: SCO family protein [Deltaproteobacteria bacterium]|nr:SCO family protein [Deltaproteobacteria bacterium]